MNDLMVRISARNNSAKGFAEVKAEADAAARSISQAGDRASAGMQRAAVGANMLARSSNAAAMQQKNLLFQLNDIGVSLAGGMNPLMVLAQQGGQLATIYGPEEGGLGKALKETGNLAAGLVTKFWPVAAAVGLGTAAVAGMTAEINKAGGQQVTFGDVALATWNQFTSTIYDLVQPAITAIGGWFGQMWDTTWPYIKTAGNLIVGTFVGAFDALKIYWSAFPAVIGDIVFTTVNNVIGGVESMINGTINLINDFQKSVGLAGDLGAVKFAGVENPYQGVVASVAQDMLGSFDSVFNTDFLGGAFDAIAKGAKDLAAAREAADATTDSLGKLGKAAGKAAADSVAGNAEIKSSMWDMASEASTLLGQIFEDSKEAKIAGAVLDGAAGIAKTLGSYAFPFNIGMAGLHAAAMAAQIQKIASTSPTSKSLDTSIAGGSNAGSAATGTGGVTQGVSISLTGNSFSAQGVMGLLNELQSALGMQGKQITISHVNGA